MSAGITDLIINSPYEELPMFWQRDRQTRTAGLNLVRSPPKAESTRDAWRLRQLRSAPTSLRV